MKKEPEICKNCSAEIIGKYCHQCGQKYHYHKETFGSLVFEFITDFLHFDSKFFKTALPLLFAPGRLTRLYNSGKRQSQYHPIKLYIFCSFLYFLFFFAHNNPLKEMKGAVHTEAKQEASADSVIQETAGQKHTFVKVKNENMNLELTVPASIDSMMKHNITPEAYKQDQKLRPRAERDGLLTRMMTVRLLAVNQEGESGRKEFFLEVLESFLHNIPKMLFILLPVFAFYLKMLYYRKRQFHYVDHAIMSLHYFSFIFLMLTLCSYGLDWLFGTLWFTILGIGWIMVYLYIVMKRLYQQGWFITLVKYSLLGLLFIATMLFLTFLNLAWSALA